MTDENDGTTSLLNWNNKQGHILSGGGKIESCFISGRDYNHPQDLPHYLKSCDGDTMWKTFTKWRNSGHRSHALVGAWSRPLFTGGWEESGFWDTHVFNLQTPSIFIDIRFPIFRPIHNKQREKVKSFDDLSLDELRILSRQHAFAGYSDISVDDAKFSESPVVTRHHAIDWNFHPKFPRSRPNKWRAELQKNIPQNMRNSFKEWGFAKDKYGQSLYMERWELLRGGKGSTYFAMRKKLCSEFDTSNNQKKSKHDGNQKQNEAIFCIVGNWFAFIRDRTHPLSDYPSATGGVLFQY